MPSRSVHFRLQILAAIMSTVTAVSAASARLDFARLVDIGDGRRIFLECRGAGSPTVILISGKGNGAADWNEILDPADPAHSATTDAVGAGRGDVHASESAVLPMVSRFTRVCAYDRPGTRIEGPDVSTPIPQPHSIGVAVDDLHAVLAASGEPRPYVLVAHSYGGLIATLYARTYPGDVAGLVMVDAATELTKQVASPAALAAWDASNRTGTRAVPEAVELADAFEKIKAAPALPKLPAVVLSADKPWRSSDVKGETGEQVTFAEWRAAQDLLAASLDARHVTATRSGHNIYLYEPQLVVDAIRDVVGAVRSNLAPVP